MKYIPTRFKTLFDIDFLGRTWEYGGVTLLRAEKLYTANNYRAFLSAFRDNFPEYVYFCPFRKKEVISAPLDTVKRVYVPRESLRSLVELGSRDSLQETTLDLVNLLSDKSGIAIQDFGVHGSIALDMYTDKSDIDIVVYGAKNFRVLERTIDVLVKTKALTYQTKNRLDAVRHFRGRYRHKIFMYNAVRKPEEVSIEYGALEYSRIHPLRFRCTVKDDSEAMFRPATYEIEDYKPSNTRSEISKGLMPRLLVSMIGCYRNVARKGDKIEVSGTLERAANTKTGEAFYQVVVGTGVSEEESICPI